MAQITVGDRPGERFSDSCNGIWAVDDHDIPDGPVRYIRMGQVAAGNLLKGVPLRGTP